MTKQQPQPTSQPPYDTTRLVVWGERRKEPDWDTYIAALLAYALREVEGESNAPEGADDD
jgi:hypothetical protein